MSFRRFSRHVVTVARVSQGLVSGTKQGVGSYSSIEGMLILECLIQPVSSTPIATDGGIAFAEIYRLVFNKEQMPYGSEIREGDQVTPNGSTDVYEITQANRVQDRHYQCYATRKSGNA